MAQNLREDKLNIGRKWCTASGSLLGGNGCGYGRRLQTKSRHLGLLKMIDSISEMFGRNERMIGVTRPVAACG